MDNSSILVFLTKKFKIETVDCQSAYEKDVFCFTTRQPNPFSVDGVHVESIFMCDGICSVYTLYTHRHCGTRSFFLSFLSLSLARAVGFVYEIICHVSFWIDSTKFISYYVFAASREHIKSYLINVLNYVKTTGKLKIFHVQCCSILFRMHCILTKHQEGDDDDEEEEEEEVQMNERVNERATVRKSGGKCCRNSLAQANVHMSNNTLHTIPYTNILQPVAGNLSNLYYIFKQNTIYIHLV